MASYWAPLDPDHRAWQPILKIRYLFLLRMLISLIFIAASVVGMVILAIQMRSIPTIHVITPNNRVLWTDTEPFELVPQIVAPFMGDVITALYTRTEAGRVIKNMDELVDPAILTVIDTPFLNRQEPFTVSLVVMETKMREGSIYHAVTSFKTLVSSRTASEYTSAIVYFDTKWVRVKPTPANPLGWLLTGLVVSSENLFNRERIIEEIRERTALVGDVPLVESLGEDEVSAEAAPGSSPRPQQDRETRVSVPVLGSE
jgi:hypothetical protein